MPFTESDFKSRLRKTNPTEKSIAALTKYIIHNRKFYKEVQNVWLYCFRKADVESKLTIVYVVNHTLQEAKKTKPGLEKLFATKLEKIFELLGSDKTLNDYIIKKTSHVLKIWKDRNVLDEQKVKMYKKIFEDKNFRKKWAKKNAGKYPRIEISSSKSSGGLGRSRSSGELKIKDRSKSRDREKESSSFDKERKERSRSSSRRIRQKINLDQPNTPDGEPDPANKLDESIDFNYSRTLFDDGSGKIESKKLIVPKTKTDTSLLKTETEKEEIGSNENAIEDPHSPNSIKKEQGKEEKEEKGGKPPKQKTHKSPKTHKTNKNKRKSSTIKSTSERQNESNQPPKKILKTNISSNSIYQDLDWFDNVPEEIAGLNDDYINPAVIQMNESLQVNPRIFSEKMTAVLRAPPSLDSETRTWLTKLPSELADPSKIDKIVEVGLALQKQPNPDPETRRQLLQKIGNIFKDIQEFKNYLSKYNSQLSQELVQRRDLGCYLQLLGVERKKSHKYYIDRVKMVAERQVKANFNAEKIRLMSTEPTLPDVSDILPDVNQLFENDESYQR